MQHRCLWARNLAQLLCTHQSVAEMNPFVKVNRAKYNERQIGIISLKFMVQLN